MSQQISNIFIEEFLAEAQHVYQGASMLRAGARQKRGVVGNQVHFPLMGKVRAVPKTHRAPVIPANPQWARPTANLSDWHVADLTDVFEDIKTNVDERANLAKSFMMAIGRQEDQFVLDAVGRLAATQSLAGADARTDVEVGGTDPTPFNVSTTVSGTSRPSGLIGACLARLLNNEVPENGDFMAVLPAFWYEAFASDEAIANKFYGETDVQRQGLKGRRLVSHGIELVFLGDRTDSASDINTVGQGWRGTGSAVGQVFGYVWEKNAIGLAYGMDPTLKVDWEPMYTSWLTCMGFSAGSTPIDTGGIVRITNGPYDPDRIFT